MKTNESGPGDYDPNMFAPVPGDPFHWRLQQFSALHHLRYPVELEQLSREATRIRYAKSSGLDPREERKFDAWYQQYPSWYLPKVNDPDFVPWIIDDLWPETADLFDLSEKQHKALKNHPAHLATSVSEGRYRAVHQYINSLRGGQPVTVRPNEYGSTILGCYMRAMDRYDEFVQKPESVDVVYYAGGDVAAGQAPTDTERDTYQNLVKSGIRSVQSEAISALVEDYYLLMEQTVPEFADFKQPTE